MNHIRYTAGYLRKPPLLVRLPPKPKRQVLYKCGVILDLSQILEEMSCDPSLALIREVFTVDEILQSLVETPLLPLEYPPIMDRLCEAMDASPLYRDKDLHDVMLTTSIGLEVYEMDLDNILARTMGEHGDGICYQLSWIGPRTAVVSLGFHAWP